MTPHFTLNMATRSGTAARKGIDNTPDDAVLSNIKLAATALEQIHWMVGDVTSWYRCLLLNAAVGGAQRSDHMKGLAVDFRPANGYSKMDIVDTLKFLQWPYLKQVIIYDNSRHVHVALWTESPKKWPEFLVKRGGKYLPLF